MLIASGTEILWRVFTVFFGNIAFPLRSVLTRLGVLSHCGDETPRILLIFTIDRFLYTALLVLKELIYLGLS